jgi:hypothetical protein
MSTLDLSTHQIIPTQQEEEPSPPPPPFLKWNRNPAKPTIEIDPAWRAPNPYWFDQPRIDREQWITALVKEHGWIRGAELGVWKGRTFLFILENCPDLSMVGVDLWAPQPENEGLETYDGEEWQHKKFERNVRKQAKKFGDRATIIKDWTTKAAEQVEDDSLDFIFVDADHSTEAVRNDIQTWWPKVKDTGWIIGHDINWPIVKVVADELLPGYVIGPDNAWGRPKCPE